MTSYEEALAKARELKPDIDNCTEYEKGYVFGCHADDAYDGGGHVPCVILKEDGRAVSFPLFLVQGAGKEIRAFDI